ncbi:hypothetical protein H1C71_000619 [Ictidomys tridecemlineatus]|nr:hypothetical protein H1C71_000619 [Ictidomys tridecemlineatus]
MMCPLGTPAALASSIPPQKLRSPPWAAPFFPHSQAQLADAPIPFLLLSCLCSAPSPPGSMPAQPASTMPPSCSNLLNSSILCTALSPSPYLPSISSSSSAPPPPPTYPHLLQDQGT